MGRAAARDRPARDRVRAGWPARPARAHAAAGRRAAAAAPLAPVPALPALRPGEAALGRPVVAGPQRDDVPLLDAAASQSAEPVRARAADLDERGQHARHAGRRARAAVVRVRPAAAAPRRRGRLRGPDDRDQRDGQLRLLRAARVRAVHSAGRRRRMASAPAAEAAAAGAASGASAVARRTRRGRRDRRARRGDHDRSGAATRRRRGAGAAARADARDGSARVVPRLRPLREHDEGPPGDRRRGQSRRHDLARIRVPLQARPARRGAARGGSADAAPRLADVVRGARRVRDDALVPGLPAPAAPGRAARPGAARARSLRRRAPALSSAPRSTATDSPMPRRGVAAASGGRAKQLGPYCPTVELDGDELRLATELPGEAGAPDQGSLR